MQFAAVAIIFLGVVLNVPLLQFLFASDGVISGRLRTVIWIVQVVIVIGGVAIFSAHRRIDAGLRLLVPSYPCVVAATVGAAGIVAAVLAVELSFYSFNILSARHRPTVVVHYSAPLWQPGVACDSRKTIGDRVIYDVTYRRDATGARVTPASAEAAAGQDLVFFGGSFTFGQGVQDEETLPNRVAQLAPGWHVTNLGYPGHGPAQMLDRLQKPGGLRGLTDNRTVVVDVFIPDHVRRTIGSMRVATTWGRQYPQYVLNAEGNLERRGTFADGRPALSRAYEYLAREPVMKCFNVDLPIRLMDPDLALVARIETEAQTLIRRANSRADFVVVLFPDRPDVEFPAARLVPHLEAAGVPYLDYSTRLQGDDGMWIPGDGHPTPEAYARVADWIADDLELRDPEAARPADVRMTD